MDSKLKHYWIRLLKCELRMGEWSVSGITIEAKEQRERERERDLGRYFFVVDNFRLVLFIVHTVTGRIENKTNIRSDNCRIFDFCYKKLFGSFFSNPPKSVYSFPLLTLGVGVD